MPANGFIGFITSQGFFIGLIFGTIKSDDPFDILLYTAVIMAAFYMFAQIMVSYFVRYVDVKTINFASKDHEIMLDYYAQELQKREDVYDEGFDFEDEEETIKPSGVKNAA